MNQNKNQERYLLVGTSHISPESKKRIIQAYNSFKPEEICIELDVQRFRALQNKEHGSLNISAIKKIGLTGYLFAVIGRIIQKKLGGITGMNPGEDMLLGAELAQQNKLKLHLIDQDANTTLRNLSKNVKFKEKMLLLWDVITAPFSKKKIKIDIQKIPKEELIQTLLKEMKTRYPGLNKALLEDRNKYMAKKLFLLLKNNPEKKYLAIMGAGHIEGVKKHLNELYASNLIQ